MDHARCGSAGDAEGLRRTMTALLVALHAGAAAGSVSFGALTKVGETWYGGTWGKLDAQGVPG